MTPDDFFEGEQQHLWIAVGIADGPDGLTEGAAYGDTPMQALELCSKELEFIENGEDEP